MICDREGNKPPYVMVGGFVLTIPYICIKTNLVWKFLTEAKRQVASLDTLIDANDRRIDDEIEPKLIDARVDMRALDRDRENGVISRSDYLSEKQMIAGRVSNLLNTKNALKEQNAEYARRQREVLANAEAQKKQVDTDTSANVDQATTQQNSNILNRIIWGLGR